MQLEYTTQIQIVQTSIKQSEFNKKQKENEIKNLQKSIDNCVVLSEISGVIKSINETSGTDQNGNELPFISISASGDYRIRGSIDEQSYQLSGIFEGQEVIIRSRVDENKTWKGIISKIDLENEATTDNDSYYSDNVGEKATKYPFYVELESSDGLILGEHVFVEPYFVEEDSVVDDMLDVDTFNEESEDIDVGVE